jgi:hypothetical protein
MKSDYKPRYDSTPSIPLLLILMVYMATLLPVYLVGWLVGNLYKAYQEGTKDADNFYDKMEDTQQKVLYEMERTRHDK